MNRRDFFALAGWSCALAMINSNRATASPCPPPGLTLDADQTATTACGTGSSVIGQQASAMSSGSWAKVSPAPSGMIQFVRAGGLQPLGTGSGFAVAFCDKFARDPVGKKMYFLGCDHGAATIFLIYDEATNAWSKGPMPLPWGNGGADVQHGYDHTIWDTIHSKLYHRNFNSTQLRRWDGGTSWATISYASGLSYHSAANGVAFFPDMGANGRICVYQDESGTRGALISIDPVTLAVTTHVSGSQATLEGTGDPHNFMRYSPQNRSIVFGGGDGPARHIWKMDASGTVTQLADVPSAITVRVGPGGSGMALPFINVANGSLVVMQGLNNWRELNLSTNTWTVKGAPASIMATNTYGGTNDAYGIMACEIPEYGVVAFVKNWDPSAAAEMWLWKP